MFFDKLPLNTPTFIQTYLILTNLTFLIIYITLIFDLSLDKIIAPAAVAVDVIDIGFCPPYSVGNLKCLSLVELWLDVIATAFLARLLLTKIDAKDILSVNVEHAANTPNVGINIFLKL